MLDSDFRSQSIYNTALFVRCSRIALRCYFLKRNMHNTMHVCRLVGCLDREILFFPFQFVLVYDHAIFFVQTAQFRGATQKFFWLCTV